MVQEVGGSSPLGHPGAASDDATPLTRNQRSPVSVTVTDLSPFERRLTLRLEGKPLDNAETRAARRLSRQIDVNGFRRGRAPRRMVENVVGKDRIRGEAIEDMLETMLPDVLVDTGLAPAVAPSVDEIRDVGPGVEVDIRVSLWPTLEDPPHYEGRRVELDDPPVEIDDDVIAEHLDMHREQFAELETVNRPSVAGDYVAIDLHASHDGQRVEPVSVGDFLYEAGSEGLLDGLGDNVVGCSAGDIIDFMSTLRFDAGGLGAGTPVEVRVLVKEVKEKRLPELDDDWVSDFTEFDTVEELRDQVVEQLERRRRSTVQYQLRNKVVSELTEEVDVDIPGAVIEVTASRIFDVLRRRLEAAGMGFDEYLEVARQDRETFFEQLHQQADTQVRRNVLLDSVAIRAGIEVEDHELRQAYEEVASRRDETAEELSEQLGGSVQEMSLMSDILRSKALTALVEGAVAADRDGNVLDLGLDPSGGFEIVEAEIERGDQ